MKQEQTDVIVVAAGLSGLAAAISAAENGAKVIAFEKAATTGGAANMGMGPLGVGSRFQRHHMVSITPGEAFRKHMASLTGGSTPGWCATSTTSRARPSTGSRTWESSS